VCSFAGEGVAQHNEQYANPPEKIKTCGGIVFSRQLYYRIQVMLEK
jgi:hypothetical protein